MPVSDACRQAAHIWCSETSEGPTCTCMCHIVSSQQHTEMLTERRQKELGESVNLKRQALDFLKRAEWSVGNGQCPQCMGLSPNFFDRATDTPPFAKTGHKQNCAHAELIQFIRGKVNE